ncbi:MAG TPA: DUF2892 domain-containing protein [Leucothrix sp.]|nr:DUF2892 domain-containing protein [Leucothrix sp.]
MKNAGSIDRILRIVVGLAVLGWGAYGWNNTGTFNLLALIGIVPLFTGLIGWCPAYTLLGIKTCPMKDK